MDNSFKSTIDSASSVLILLPTKPYFDQVAAGLGLYLSLKDKKDTAISCPNEMLVEFNRLVGINKVSSELGNKNLVIKFSDYKATGIERVSYDIEDGEFRLTVIPKPGVIPPTKDQIKLSFSGISADLVILIGGANETHFPSLSSKDLAGAKVLHVGTKALAISSDKEVISFARPASSTSELVTTLIKESGWEYDEDIATNLLAGLEEGSRSFSSDYITADTFQLAADLLRAGGKRKGKETRASYPQGSIPGEVSQEPEEPEEAPKEWMAPKIYKGTTVS